MEDTSRGEDMIILLDIKWTRYVVTWSCQRCPYMNSSSSGPGGKAIKRQSNCHSPNRMIIILSFAHLTKTSWKAGKSLTMENRLKVNKKRKQITTAGSLFVWVISRIRRQRWTNKRQCKKRDSAFLIASLNDFLFLLLYYFSLFCCRRINKFLPKSNSPIPQRFVS